MAGVREGQGQLVFGLDIGTRSIVGTVGYLSGERFHVVAQRAREHETRAMLDGQIHDIEKVGQTIKRVKEQLEEDLDRRLTEVCIAAAGRVLRTVTTHAEQTFEGDHEVTEEDVYALSTMGVEQAYSEFLKTNDTEMKFYCVGYTPSRFYMNGYQIGNLAGHKVRSMAVDLIATFLPDDVVDGLYKAVGLAGLHVANLTLEPIAAIQVAIPEKFRLLNMALVDVGAGTSDVSITKEGTITAYGMIPVAGDSLTDIIVQHCLVDFDTAEKIKRQAGNREKIEYQDIMGLSQTISAGEVEEILEPAVRSMAEQAAACIRELNGEKAVSAVFVVGGGGMVPGYTEKLAEELNIAKERVAIRGQEVMQGIDFELDNPIRDSLMVTPIGICLSYYEQNNSFIFVDFNGRRIRLYDNGKLSVADAAVQSELSNENLFPKRGTALNFMVNGKSRIVRGALGEAALIRLNGEPADIHTRVHNGDRVEVISSTAGEAAHMELGRLPELGQSLHVTVNGVGVDLPKTASVNGRLENEFYSIQENDDIQVQNSYTVREIAEFTDIPLGGGILVNDTPAKPETRVYENFTVSWEESPEDICAEASDGRQEEVPAGQEMAEHRQPETSAAGQEMAEQRQPEASAVGQETAQQRQPEASAAGQETAEQRQPEASAAGQEAAQQPGSPVKMSVLVNGLAVTLTGKSSYVFVDVFSFIDFDLKASGGRAIVTNLNGRGAEYMEPLHDGDVIEIYWKNLKG